MSTAAHIDLVEPRVAGALFGAIAAGRVYRGGTAGRDYLAMADPRTDGADLDVTDFMDAVAEAGYAKLGGNRTWQLTPDGEVRASAYAVSALRNPDVLFMRKAWMAMSGALMTLAAGQEPAAHRMVDIPAGHRTYLLGHHVLHRQMQELYDRHRRATEMVDAWLRGLRDEQDRMTPATLTAYGVLALLRGEDVSELEKRVLVEDAG